MQAATINNINFTAKDKTNKKTKNVKESFAAGAASTAANLASVPIGMAVISKMQKISNGLTSEQVKTVQESADKMLKSTGLEAKGVKIENLIDEGPWIKNKFADKIVELLFPIRSIQKGNNAMFADKISTVCMPPDGKLSLTVFHELGHAHDYNTSKIGRLLYKSRMPGMALAGFLALFAAFSKEAKVEDGKELTKGQRVKNFVRKNAGPLAFAAMLPTLAEEAMASVKGCKWANANMAKDLAKKVAKTNVVAYCSYLATAAAVGLAAHVAVKVKDGLVAKKEAKLSA